MSGYLIDTHALLWWWNDDPRLSGTARELLADGERDVAVPSVCAWEIANKVRIGKLPEMIDHIGRYDELVMRAGFRPIDLRSDHAIRGGLLAGEHRDPFDRLIAGQALVERMIIITRDPAFAALGCETFW